MVISSRISSDSGQIQAKHLYQISQAVATSLDWRDALRSISALIRPFCAHDQILIFSISGSQNSELQFILEPMNAGQQVLGEDLDIFMQRVLDESEAGNDLIIQTMDGSGLPALHAAGICLRSLNCPPSAMIFLRRSDPSFTTSDAELLGFIAENIRPKIEQEILMVQMDQIKATLPPTATFDEFLSTIAHEIKSPLGYIKGYTSTLLRPGIKWRASDRQKFLQIIDQETDRLVQLLESLLTASNLQAQTNKIPIICKMIRLDELLNHTIDLTRIRHPDFEIEVINRPGENLEAIEGDGQRLIQVFDNLFTNSLKHAPGSKIIVTIIQDIINTEVSVEDFGPGIPEIYQPNLFNRYFRVPGQADAVHGYGLGLFICKQIVEAHAGHIKLDSTPGKGCLFKVILPNKQTHGDPG
jgi:signal transduction histidine kinase